MDLSGHAAAVVRAVHRPTAISNRRRIEQRGARVARATRARPRCSQTSDTSPSEPRAEMSEGQAIGSRDTARRSPDRSSGHTRRLYAPLPLSGLSPSRGAAPLWGSMPSDQGTGGASYQVSLYDARTRWLVRAASRISSLAEPVRPPLERFALHRYSRSPRRSTRTPHARSAPKRSHHRLCTYLRA